MWNASSFSIAQCILDALSTPSIAILLCAIAAGWYVCAPSAQIRALAKLPRPESTLPLLGNTLDLMFRQRERLHDWVADECIRQNGKP
jgi:hypothetical protein